MYVFSGTQLSLSEASTLALFCLHCGLIFEWLLSLPMYMRTLNFIN